MKRKENAVRRRTPPPTETPRLFDLPESLQRAHRNERQRQGVVTYEKPFELASILRAYGVRVLSSLGPRAELALRELAEHRDPRVRQAVVEELVRHRDVAAVVTLARLAVYDEEAVVREAAQSALVELRRLAETEASVSAPLLETGEEYRPSASEPEAPPHGATSESSEPSASS